MAVCWAQQGLPVGFLLLQYLVLFTVEFCLCCVAALKSLPALSFNALIFPILRMLCTISFHYSCTTTELSKLLTSFLTAVKKHVIKYCEKGYEWSGKTLFWSIKKSGEILDKLKARDFNATSLSTHNFSTLYTTKI